MLRQFLSLAVVLAVLSLGTDAFGQACPDGKCPPKKDTAKKSEKDRPAADKAATFAVVQMNGRYSIVPNDKVADMRKDQAEKEKKIKDKKRDAKDKKKDAKDKFKVVKQNLASRGDAQKCIEEMEKKDKRSKQANNKDGDKKPRKS